MPDNPDIIAIMLTFLLAGTVKGVLGLGLPTVSLGLLTLLADLPTAMTVMLLPALLTNLWQAFAGQHTRGALLRLWPLLVAAGLSVAIGGLLFKQIQLQWLTVLLGLLIVLYSLISLAGIKLTLSPASETSTGMACGLVNGILGGLTGSFVVPGVMYLQALDMPRQMLLQSMGLLFSISTVALAISLWANGLLNQSMTQLSFWAVFPALLGMPLGQWLGKHLPDKHFRTLFFCSIGVIGGFILLGGIAGNTA